MKPLKRRVSNFPPVSARNVHVRGASSRSESLRRAMQLRENYHAPRLANNMDRFRFDPTDVASSRGGGTPDLDLQRRPSATQMGNFIVDGDDEGVDATAVSLTPLAEFQPETWWPAVNVINDDDHGRDEVAIGDSTTPARTQSPPTSSYAMGSSCFDVINSNVSVDFCNQPSAIAVVSAAQGITISPSPSTTSELTGRCPSLKRKRPVSTQPDQNHHILSEKQRRQSMNCLFATLQSLLPRPASKTDKATLVWETTEYICLLQVKLKELTKQQKQQQMLAARTRQLSANNSYYDVMTTAPSKAFVSKGLTVLDHSSSVTTLPPPGRGSCLHSHVGPNVVLHVCGVNAFISASSPRRRGRFGLLQQLLVTLHNHHLDAINATISTSNLSLFHYLHCQVSPDVELLNNAGLHSALQSVIDNFG